MDTFAGRPASWWAGYVDAVARLHVRVPRDISRLPMEPVEQSDGKRRIEILALRGAVQRVGGDATMSRYPFCHSRQITEDMR